MEKTLAFDVYGTLINTSGIYETLHEMMGEPAGRFMASWRDKQLEYSFRRGVMNQHTDFSVCTRNSLNYCCTRFDINLTDEQRKSLMDTYKILPAFPDVAESVASCRRAGYGVYAFSNGSASAVSGLLTHAGILDQFDGVISTEKVRMFKPSPVVYNHFLTATKSEAQHTWLISGNPFDVIGAAACGWNTAWVKRMKEAQFDPWDYSPTITISGLDQLLTSLSET